jgi:hypothetical protein
MPEVDDSWFQEDRSWPGKTVHGGKRRGSPDDIFNDSFLEVRDIFLLLALCGLCAFVENLSFVKI